MKEDTESGEAKVDLDTILVHEIGQWGRFQKRTVALCAGFVVFVAWAASSFNFTTARISTRCLIPECDGPVPSFSPPWLQHAVPAAGPGSLAQCERYHSTNLTDTFDAACPAAMFDQRATRPCEDYVYENTNTVVYDYGLACNEWRRSLIGSARTLGTLCALPITGFVSDRWGRRAALAINAVNTAWIGILRYWANTYWGFLVSEFMEATFGAGAFSCAYILVMELMGPNYRVAAGATMNSFFSVGQILLGLIAWAVPDWRTLTLVLFVPQLTTIYFFWSSESVRWLMSKGRYEEAEKFLKNIAKVNGTTLSEKSLEVLRRTNEEEVKRQEAEALAQSEQPWLPVLVFRHKPILVRCLVAPVWWITALFVYYGLSINSVNMSGNRYLNFVAVSAVEIPGYWTSVFLLNKIGRKPVLIAGFWVCAACMIAYVFLPTGMPALSLAVYLVGKYSIAVVMAANYAYTAELLPTRHRHRLFAFASMMGRVGSVLAPLTPALGQTLFTELPFAIFAALSLVAGGLVFITPETKGLKMPDTMEEAAALGKEGNREKRENSVPDQGEVIA